MNKNWIPRHGFLPALSIQNPWAWLIIHQADYPNGKDIENRDWTTAYRGPLLIHAGKQVDASFFANDGKTVFLPYAERICGNGAALMPQNLADYERGGIVGIAHLVDVVTESTSPWFHGRYGFVLRDARPLPFKAVRGQLGLFAVEWEGATV